MFAVNIALMPTAIASIYIFGLRSLMIILISVATCIVTEIISQVLFKRKITAHDGSAIVTGILLAFNFPVSIPWWMVVIAGVVAIFLVKQLFGGLGYNIFNPALASRAVLLASFPVHMTSWAKPILSFSLLDAVTAATSGANAVTTATPLAIVKLKLNQPLPSYLDLFLGNVPGSLGETCKLALIVGGLFLIIIRVVDWRIPVIYISSVFILSFLFKRDPIFEILSGGIILCAFFMATDIVTAPTTKMGRVLFAAGCGILTAIIRSFGGFPEGVCYSILFMNCLSPLIEKYVRPKIFGTVKAKGEAV
jgi:electron transport complex protein RnfD